MSTAKIIGSQLGELPITALITSLAKGIAEAQLALDQVAMQVAQMMAGTEDENRVRFGNKSYSLLELGLTPTFYHFTETVLEVKLAISLTIRGQRGDKFAARNQLSHSVRSIDATFVNKYQYNVEGASRVQTRMVPIPPPTIFDERVRELMEAERNYRELMQGADA